MRLLTNTWRAYNASAGINYAEHTNHSGKAVEFKQLEAFYHVAELGSFTRAATILDTTQPALSRLVRQLEGELRHSLLMRNGRGVAVTEAGKVFLAHAKAIVQQVEHARQNLNELRGSFGGHFSVGMLPSVGRTTASQLVRDFHTSFPESTISIAEGLSTHLLEWLQIGRIDAAILYDTSYTPLIDKTALLEQELFLVGPPAIAKASSQVVAPIPFSDISNYKLIMPSRLHGVRHSIESRAAEMGLRLNIAIEVDSVPSILDLVQDGFGYAVLTTNTVYSDPLKREFSLAPFAKPMQSLRLVLATGRRHPLSRLAIKAIKLVEHNVMSLYANLSNEPKKAVNG